MKWSQMFSKRVGTAMGLFGLLNVAGAVVDALNRHSSDVILPGIAIGGVWAAVGFKRGLPIVPVSGDSDVPRGLRAIRRRFLVLTLTVCAWFPSAAIILPEMPRNAMMTAFFLVALPPLLASVWWALSACPRCQEHFFPVGRLRVRFSFSRCQHCGLQMKRGTHESNESSRRPH